MARVPEPLSQGHRTPPWPDHLPRAYMGSWSSLWWGSDFLEFLLLTAWRSPQAQSHAIPMVRWWNWRRARKSKEGTHSPSILRGLSDCFPTRVRQGNNAQTSLQARINAVLTRHSLPISILHRKIKGKGKNLSSEFNITGDGKERKKKRSSQKYSVFILLLTSICSRKKKKIVEKD